MNLYKELKEEEVGGEFTEEKNFIDGKVCVCVGIHTQTHKYIYSSHL